MCGVWGAGSAPLLVACSWAEDLAQPCAGLSTGIVLMRQSAAERRRAAVEPDQNSLVEKHRGTYFSARSCCDRECWAGAIPMPMPRKEKYHTSLIRKKRVTVWMRNLTDLCLWQVRTGLNVGISGNEEECVLCFNLPTVMSVQGCRNVVSHPFAVCVCVCACGYVFLCVWRVSAALMFSGGLVPPLWGHDSKKSAP